MTTPAQGWARTVRIAQGVGGVGFILARLLLSVCNIPALCGPLAGVQTTYINTAGSAIVCPIQSSHRIRSS